MTVLPRPVAAIRSGFPLVTVIVPCFREGRYLNDCLSSIRNQTYPHLEILVIEDAGKDDSLAVALEHALEDDRIELLRTMSNIGLGAVRNLGTRKARGDLLLFLDGDDWIPPDAIAARVEALAEHLRPLSESDAARVAGVFGDWEHTMFSTGPDHPVRPGRQLATIDLASSRGSNVFIVSAPLVRHDVLLLTGGFAEGVRGGEDHLAWMRILALDMVFVPCQHLVAFYRQKVSSMLRQSVETFAAFALATRRWIGSAVADLPGRDTEPIVADMVRPRAGEVLVLWGRHRRRLTRVAAVGAAGNRSTLPPATGGGDRAPSDLDEATEAPLRNEVETAEGFLSGGPGEQPQPNVVHFHRGSAHLTIDAVDGASVGPLPRDRPTKPADVVVLATTVAEGFEAGAVAVALSRSGLLTELHVTAPARRGALGALAMCSLWPSGLRFATNDVPNGRVHLQMTTGAERTDSNTGLSERFTIVDEVRTGVGGARAATPGSELINSLTDLHQTGIVVVVPSDGNDPSAQADWLAHASDVAGANDLSVLVTTLTSDTSRSFSDAATPHLHGSMIDLTQASAVICEDAGTAALAYIANPVTLLLTDEQVSPRTAAGDAAELRALLTSADRGRNKASARTAEVVERVNNALRSVAGGTS